MLHVLQPTNRCGDFWPMWYEKGGKVGGLWTTSGNLDVVKTYSLKKGLVDDPYYPRVFGLGFRGKGLYTKTKNPQVYQVWHNMMRRCYGASEMEAKYYQGKGVSVHKDWHNFQNFAKWYLSYHVDNWDMEKDLLSDKSLYSSETCCFLPREVNILMASWGKGVHYSQHYQCYIAKYSSASNNHYIGRFEDKESGRKAADRYRAEHLRKTSISLFEESKIPEKVFNKLMEVCDKHEEANT